MTDKKVPLSEAGLNSQKSKKTGIAGLFENILRKFTTFISLLVISPIAFFYLSILSLSALPGFYIFVKTWDSVIDASTMIKAVSLSFAFGTGFVLFGIAIIFVVPIFNLPFLIWLKIQKSYKGPWLSVQTIPWYFHNALLYLVRYTVIDLMTPTPFNTLFYRLMGMKIGKNANINTSNISDACLIELEDNVTIGGSAHLMAHYGMHGLLVIDKVTIGKNTTIGLKASVFGGVTIGPKVTVAPNATVLPKTIIKEGEKFGFDKDEES